VHYCYIWQLFAMRFAQKDNRAKTARAQCVSIKAQKLSEMHSRCGQQSRKNITLNLSQKGLLGLMSFTPPN